MSAGVEVSIPGTNVPMAKVAADVIRERVAQNAKWGEQNHPDGTGAQHEGHASDYRMVCDTKFRDGNGTWKDILLEEVYEALAESDPERLRAELVQVAAVAAGRIEAVDRRPRAS